MIILLEKDGKEIEEGSPAHRVSARYLHHFEKHFTLPSGPRLNTGFRVISMAHRTSTKVNGAGTKQTSFPVVYTP